MTRALEHELALAALAGEKSCDECGLPEEVCRGFNLVTISLRWVSGFSSRPGLGLLGADRSLDAFRLLRDGLSGPTRRFLLPDVHSGCWR